MSAAAARRRKQMAARKQKEAAAAASGSGGGVGLQLQTLLQKDELSEESVAYEALQLAQSVVRKDVAAGDYTKATLLAYEAGMAILRKGRVSVASQLLSLLLDVLKEGQIEETTDWIEKLTALHVAHGVAMVGSSSSKSSSEEEIVRLHRLQRDWLRRCVHWSSEFGVVRLGNPKLHALLGQECWALAALVLQSGDSTETTDSGGEDDENNNKTEEDVMEFRCDAVVHWALAELPQKISEHLGTLANPTEEETKTGHSCPPSERDALFTRAILCFAAMENLRDANTLCRTYMEEIETRKIDALIKSYVNKEDGKAPSHTVFCTSLLRVCEKDARTGPLFSWLMRSFKKELDKLHKPNIVSSYTTKIGKIYFNIQPPPSMLNMMENMMNMMGGGGGGPAGGGLNPAMMQAAMAQMQQGGMM